MIISVIATISTLLLSYLFVVGAMQKLADASYFQQVITDYQILPTALSPLLARTLPLIELAAGIALLIPMSRFAALGTVTLLLTSYSIAIAINIVRGRRDIDCGCAGPGQEQTLSSWLLGRNGLLIVLALSAMAATGQFHLPWSAWTLALLGTALAALLYHVFNQLIANNNLLKRIKQHG
jgi:hypothetical protein